MKTDKEYPATHSMGTAWYCADEDGNVAIFDIEDNGPVPVGGYLETGPEWLLYDEFTHKGEEYDRLELTPEQVTAMVEQAEPIDEDTFWCRGEKGKKWGFDWFNVIVRIDMDKYDMFRDAMNMKSCHSYPYVCLSREQGWFYVESYHNAYGARMLEENDVIKEMYSGLYSDIDNEDDVESGVAQSKLKFFPVYIYWQCYCPSSNPALRLVEPAHPLKVDQLPENIRQKIKILPLKFRNSERIQLAELMPVYGIQSKSMSYDGKKWLALAGSDGGVIYYCESTNEIITEQEMEKHLKSGLAETD